MYYCRPVVRSPSVVRAARNASVFPNTPFFHPRAAAPTTNDFAPFLRLLDDFAAPLAPAYANHARQALANFGIPVISHRPSFTPSFDVQELGSEYQLRGDVPGFDGTDIDVEFTDAQTLVIRGRTERQASQSDQTKTTPETQAIEPETKDNDDNASTYSTGSYQKPTVEEGDTAGEVAESSSDAQARATDASAEAQTIVAEASAPKQDGSKFWFQERSTGSFQRVFKFEERVDQEAVKASLKNGILSILVPKATAPAARRINIE